MRFGLFNFLRGKDDDDEQESGGQPQQPAPEQEPAAPPPAEPEPEAAELPLNDSVEVEDEESSMDVLSSFLTDEDSSDDDLLGITQEEPEFEEEELSEPQAATPPADTIYVPADLIIPYLPEEYLAAPPRELIKTYRGQSDFVFSFTRSDLMYTLSRAKLEMTAGDLATKISIEVFRNDIGAYGDQVLSLPLNQIVPLIPPAWMARTDQDDSKERTLADMPDYFADLGMPAPEAAEVLPEEEEELLSEDLAEEAYEEPTQAADVEDAIPTQEFTREEQVAPEVVTDQPEQPQIELSYEQELEPVGEEQDYAEPELALDEDDELGLTAPTIAQEPPVEELDTQPAPEPEDITEDFFDEEMGEDEPMLAEEPILAEEPASDADEYTEEERALLAELEAEEAAAAEAKAAAEAARAAEEEAAAEAARAAEEAAAAEAARAAEEAAAAEAARAAEEAAAAEAARAAEEAAAAEAARAAEEAAAAEAARAAEEAAAAEAARAAEEAAAAEAARAAEEVIPPVIVPPGIIPAPDPVPQPVAPSAAEPTEPEQVPELSDELLMADPGDVAKDVFGKPRQPLGGHQKDTRQAEAPETPWRSQAPNGINVNRTTVEELCHLPGIGEHLAQSIIDHRKAHGDFKDLRDLLKITGLGRRTYRGMTGLSPSADLGAAEMEVNTALDIDTKTVLISDVARASVTKLHLEGMFIIGPDGLLLAKFYKDPKIGKLADSMAGIAPQLYRRGRRSLTQGKIPDPDMMTFYVNRHAVTFAGSEEILIASIHQSAFPSARDLRAIRKVIRELTWYCSYRAVV